MYEMNYLSFPFKMVKDGEVICTYERLEFWKYVAESMTKAVENVYEECFVVCALNEKQNPLCIYFVRGGIPSIHVADIFRIALLYNSPNILVAHKYPNKTAIPTADLRFFMDITDISPLIGVKITDYILIGGKEIVFSVKGNPDILDQWANPEEFVSF